MEDLKPSESVGRLLPLLPPADSDVWIHNYNNGYIYIYIYISGAPFQISSRNLQKSQQQKLQKAKTTHKLQPSSLGLVPFRMMTSLKVIAFMMTFLGPENYHVKQLVLQPVKINHRLDTDYRYPSLYRPMLFLATVNESDWLNSPRENTSSTCSPTPIMASHGLA